MWRKFYHHKKWFMFLKKIMMFMSQKWLTHSTLNYVLICLFAHVYFYFERIPKTIMWKGSYWSFLKISEIEMCHVNRTESPFYLNLHLWYFIVVWILLFWIEKDHILLLDFNFFLSSCYIFFVAKSNCQSTSQISYPFWFPLIFFFLYEYSLRDFSVIINFHWDIIL